MSYKAWSEEFHDREDLKVDELYWSENDHQYFLTPDHIGGYWFDFKEDADFQYGPFNTIHHVKGING